VTTKKWLSPGQTLTPQGLGDKVTTYTLAFMYFFEKRVKIFFVKEIAQFVVTWSPDRSRGVEA
jgi:hypothetical protein